MTIKYKFVMEDDCDNDFEYGPARHIEHTVTGEQTWPELLVHIRDWMKGIGYVIDGELDLVDPDTRESEQHKIFKND